MDLGNGRKEMQKKPIENRNTPLVIPIPKASKTEIFKVYDESVIVKAGVPIAVSDETKEIFRLSKDIFKK